MADKLLILGESGSGKSTSIRNLDPKSTFVINTISKALPFKGWKSNYTIFSKDHLNGNLLNSSQPVTIISAMKYVSDKRPEIKVIVLEDIGYMTSLELFDRARETGFGKFTDVAVNLKNVATLPDKLRDDLMVIFIMHPEVSTDIEGNKQITSKVSGKMISNQLNFEGLFEKVLYAKSRKTKEKGIEFGFETKTDTFTPAKTPMDMFSDDFIPNDLKQVLEAIDQYNHAA